jgi:SynChlorMet cassette radical SAM/SPASM protein ScmF
MPDKTEGNLDYPLRSIYFYPTESCNLRCIHCWIKPDYAPDEIIYNKLNKQNISTEDMEMVIKDALPLGLTHVKITGGEPLMTPNLWEYIDCFSRNGLSYSLETNGTLLTEKTVDKLNKRHLKQISVSLDGSCPEVHERIRGIKGSFHKTINGIRLLIENNIFPQIIFCLMRINAHDLENTIILADKLGVRSFEINPLALLGRDGHKEKGLEGLSVEELINLENRIENECSQRFPDMRIDLYLPPALKGIKELSRHPISTCKIHNICGILSNGDVSICGIGRRKRELIMGNIKERTIAQIWKEGSVFKEIREKVPSKMEGICGKCIFRYHCLGFCRVDVLVAEMPLVASYSVCEEVFQKGLFPDSRML